MSRFDDIDRDDEGEEEVSELWVDRYIISALREPTLGPLVLVVIGVVVAFIAPALLFAIRAGRVYSIMALLILGFGSFAIVRFDIGRHRRPAIFSKVIFATWLASCAGAWACDHWGLL